MEYDCSNADRLGNDAWIGAVFFMDRIGILTGKTANTEHQENQ